MWHDHDIFRYFQILLIYNVFSDILTYIFLIYRLFSDTFNKYSSTFSKFVIFSLRLTSWQISISGRLYKCQKQTERGVAIEQIISNCCWELKLGKFKNCWASTVISESRFDPISLRRISVGQGSVYNTIGITKFCKVWCAQINNWRIYMLASIEAFSRALVCIVQELMIK